MGPHGAAGELGEVDPAFREEVLGQAVDILDGPDRDNGIGPEMGADHHRLVVVVADHPDPGAASETGQVVLELAAELGVADVVDHPVDGAVAEDGHASPLGAQVRVVVGTEEQVAHALVLRGYRKKIHPCFTPRWGCPPVGTAKSEPAASLWSTVGGGKVAS